MLELLLQLLGEFLLQAIGEALVEFGLHSLAEPFRSPPNPWLAAIGYGLFGAIFGGLSLLAFPVHLTPAGPLRMANLVLTPIGVGVLMAASAPGAPDVTRPCSASTISPTATCLR